MCLKNQPENLKGISGSFIIKPKDGIIYWHIREDKLTSDMDKYKVILAFENGFKILEKQFYPIQFKSTSKKEDAPIIIGFYKNGDADLPQKFDQYTLAYAFANYGEGFEHSSDMYFNDAYKWAELDKPGQEVNLKKVFVHECMHALGFEHSQFKEDILFWQYQTTDEINFTEDTKKAILDRYGEEMKKITGGVQVADSKKVVIDFCKTVIDFKRYKNIIPAQIFMNVLKYFGIGLETTTIANKEKLIKYLDNG